MYYNDHLNDNMDVLQLLPSNPSIDVKHFTSNLEAGPK